MAGRVPIGSGANQNRVFIDLTDETELGDSEVVSACARFHFDLLKIALLEPATFPLAPIPAPLWLSLSRQFLFSLPPANWLPKY